MTARYCSWCGHALESGARFCSQCGARVVESVIVPDESVADDEARVDIEAGRKSTVDSDSGAVCESETGRETTEKNQSIDDNESVEHDESTTNNEPDDSEDLMRGFDIVGGKLIYDDASEKSSARNIPSKAATEFNIHNGSSDKTIKLNSISSSAPGSTIKMKPTGTGKPDDTDTLIIPIDSKPKKYVTEESKKTKKSKNSKASKGSKKKRVLVIICFVLVIVVLALAVAYATGLLDESLQQLTAEAESGLLGGEAEDDSQTESLTDDEAFDLLDAAYDRLASYDESIGSCVTSFNALYLSSSMSDRTDAMDEAEELLSELQDELEALEAVVLDDSSPYTDDLANMEELYTCLIGRMQSIVDAWETDVTFDTPSEHQDEILAVLAESNENGTNKYLTEFDDLYPEAEPQRAS